MMTEKKVLIISDYYKEYISTLSVMTHVRQRFFHIIPENFDKISALNSFDLVLLDCDRDIVKGLAMLKKIKHSAPQNLTLLIGYSDSAESIVNAFRFGARDYIRKPLDPEELRKIVSVLYQARNGFQEKRSILDIPVLNPLSSETSPVHPTPLQNAKKYIDTNTACDLCLDNLANLARMSKFHFIRRFRVMTGYTPKQYILLKKIEKAKEMIAKKRYNISHLSSILGFCSPSDFSMHFKKVVGQTPSQYKKTSGSSMPSKKLH